jgi:signal transduction histidine kinase/ActR/RegA family two-component response regulator
MSERPPAATFGAEQAALFIRQIPILVGVNLVLATFIAAHATSHVGAALARCWLTAVYVLSAFRIASFLWTRARERRGHRPSPWGLAILSLLASATWGSAGWLFFTPGDRANVLLLGMVLAGQAAVAVASTSAIWPAYLSYAAPALMPFVIRALREGGAQFTIIGGLMLLFMMMNTILAHNVHRLICSALDLSRENRELVTSLEKENARAVAAARAKSTFLAAASHELRQPTHALGLLIQALENLSAMPAVPPPGHLARIAEQMQRSLDGLAQLLSTLLDISKLDAGTIRPRMGPVCVGRILETLEGEFASFAQMRGLKLIVIPSNVCVWSDPVLLKLIVANFIANAIRYTARGGVLVAARRRGRTVAIQVYDTGIGIPDAERSLIFREFHQASNAVALGMNHAGFGLGLAVVAKSAGLIGAQLQLRSHVGRGSMFSVVVEHTTMPEQPLPPANPRLTLEPRTILALDDNPHVLAALELLLSQWGHDVIPARSAAEALQRLESHPRRADLLVCDLRLPDGDVDVEHLRKVAARDGALPPVLFVTGDTSRERILQARATGHEVLHKPVPPARLARAIQEQLLAPSHAREILPAGGAK